METDGRVKFHELFKHADSTDMVLMLVGVVSAVASGVSQAIMMIIFGQVITAFGDGTPETILHRANKVALDYVYLGIGTGIVSFLQVSCWTITGERQATRIRSLYLKSVLRQDIAFFDLEMTAGQVISCASADTVLIQGAIGDKVGKFAQLVTTFLGGLTVAFVKGWLLTLVMLSTVPLFIAAGGIVSRMHSKISGEGQKSYGDGVDVVEQTVGSIRTVVSFNGEKEAVSRYNNQIKRAYKATVWEGAALGFGAGSLSFVYFSTFGLVIWYGTKLIQSGGYNGGSIISILFAVMVGGRAMVQQLVNMALNCQGGRSKGLRLQGLLLKPQEYSLLNEATSALDLESERVVQNALNRVMLDRTTLIVAHRLSTVTNADSISVVHQGKIIEQGHHNELMKDTDGAYSQLIRLQEAHQADGYQVDAGISHSRPIRSLSLQQSTSNPAGSISRRTMTPPPSLTASTESITYNDANSDKESDDGKTLKKAPIGRLLSLNKPEKSVLLLGSLAAAIHGAIIPATGFVLANAAAAVFYEPLDKRDKDSRFWSLVSVGLGTVSMVSGLANGFLFAIAGRKLIERARALAFQSIVHQEIAWFDDPINSSGALGGRTLH